MREITLRFFLEEEIVDEDYTDLDFSKVELVSTDLSAMERFVLTEHWAQSDFYWTEITWKILNAISPEIN